MIQRKIFQLRKKCVVTTVLWSIRAFRNRLKTKKISKHKILNLKIKNQLKMKKVVMKMNMLSGRRPLHSKWVMNLWKLVYNLQKIRLQDNSLWGFVLMVRSILSMKKTIAMKKILITSKSERKWWLLKRERAEVSHLAYLKSTKSIIKVKRLKRLTWTVLREGVKTSCMLSCSSSPRYRWSTRKRRRSCLMITKTVWLNFRRVNLTLNTCRICFLKKRYFYLYVE